MAAPSPLRRTKSPKSPKSSHCPIDDSDIEVELEIQDAPPYRILPKVRKPKTPPPPRPCRKPEGRKPRSSSFRAVKHRSMVADFDEHEGYDIDFYEPPKQVSFKEQLETVIPSEYKLEMVIPQVQKQQSSMPADLLDSVVALKMPDRLSPVITEPGCDSPTNNKYFSLKKCDRQKFLAFDLALQKPEIPNVKLVKRTPSKVTGSTQSSGKPRLSQSAEELNRMDIFLDLCDLNFDLKNQCLRSSFVDPDAPVDHTKKSVYIDLGDYQTLLKHSKAEEHVYSLPQPQCYGDDTLRAVKLITAKYDTFQRRQIQAESFTGDTVAKIEGEGKDGQAAAATSVAPEAVTDIVQNVPVMQDVRDSNPSPVRPQQNTSKETTPNQTSEKKSECPPGGMTENDATRIDLFYRSMGTEVMVCQCLVDLYIGTLVSGSDEVQQWNLHCTGVPVFVLNTGEGRRTRELCVLVAEKETGFPLWQDRICYLTNYAEVNPVEHTFYLTESLSKKAKLKFFAKKGATEFLSWFQDVTADPNDDLWKVSSKKPTKRKLLKGRSKQKKPSKSDISQPCNFAHVTKVDVTNPNFPQSFSSLVQSKETSEEEFRPRLPTT